MIDEVEVRTPRTERLRESYQLSGCPEGTLLGEYEKLEKEHAKNTAQLGHAIFLIRQVIYSRNALGQQFRDVLPEWRLDDLHAELVAVGDARPISPIHPNVQEAITQIEKDITYLECIFNGSEHALKTAERLKLVLRYARRGAEMKPSDEQPDQPDIR